jgi:hypothetical protein
MHPMVLAINVSTNHIPGKYFLIQEKLELRMGIFNNGSSLSTTEVLVL